MITTVKQKGNEMRIETQAARNTDPETSHEAAELVTESNLRQTQIDRVIEMVRKDEGLTSAELALKNKTCRYVLARRLADADGSDLDQGQKRKCSVSGRNAMTWFLRGE